MRAQLLISLSQSSRDRCQGCILYHSASSHIILFLVALSFIFISICLFFLVTSFAFANVYHPHISGPRRQACLLICLELGLSISSNTTQACHSLSSNFSPLFLIFLTLYSARPSSCYFYPDYNYSPFYSIISHLLLVF